MANYYADHYDAVLAEIKNEILEKKITQSELARLLGVSQPCISSMLTGRTNFSLPEFMAICEALGLKAHQIINKAESSLAQDIPMPAEFANAIYKTDAHLIAYCACSIPVTAQQLVTEDYKIEHINAALNDLLSAGIIKVVKDRYVQANPNVSYTPPREALINSHQQAMLKAWKRYEKYRNKASVRLQSFNFSYIDRFSVPQLKEIEGILYAAYEKIDSFRRENMGRGYNEGGKKMLWNFHLMSTRSLDQT